MNNEQKVFFLVRVEEIDTILQKFLPKEQKETDEEIVRTNSKDTKKLSELKNTSEILGDIHARIAVEFLYGIPRDSLLEFGYKVTYFPIIKESHINLLEEVLKKNGVYYQKIRV